MSEPHSVYITGIDFERDAWQGHSIRGLRALWEALDPNEDRGYREARDFVVAFAENPYVAILVGTHDSLSALAGAIGKALELSENVLSFALDLEDTTLGTPPEAPEDDGTDLLEGVFSPAAYKTALVNLSYAGGDATLAWGRTFSLAKATDDPSLWEEVRAVYESAFIHDGEGGQGGPPIIVVR